jgi:hypothetical protein
MEVADDFAERDSCKGPTVFYQYSLQYPDMLHRPILFDKHVNYHNECDTLSSAHPLPPGPYSSSTPRGCRLSALWAMPGHRGSSPAADGGDSAFGTRVSAYLGSLHPEQQAAVVHTEQAVVRVKAGPGSGKTRVVTARVAAQAAARVDPSQASWSSPSPTRVRHLGRIGPTMSRCSAEPPSTCAQFSVLIIGTMHAAPLLCWDAGTP